jgi:hypothetical protein
LGQHAECARVTDIGGWGGKVGAVDHIGKRGLKAHLYAFAKIEFLGYSGCNSHRSGASRSRGKYRRRLIKLIFANRNRIVMIRRELRLTTFASPVDPVANCRGGFSLVLAPAAADPALRHPADEDLSVGTLVELDSFVHR